MNFGTVRLIYSLKPILKYKVYTAKVAFMSNNYPTAIIINGEYKTLAGYSNQEHPSEVLRTVIGYTIYKSILVDNEETSKDYLIGQEALNLRGVLKLIYPIISGKIEFWDELQQFWSMVIEKEQLQVQDNKSILISTPRIYENRIIRRMVSLLQDDFTFKHIGVASNALLSLLGLGLQTGIIVDIGLNTTEVVVFQQRETMRSLLLDYGGRSITKYFRLLHRKQHGFDHGDNLEIFNDIKEKLCFIAIDLGHINPESGMRTYEMPDGEVELFSNETYLAPELLFDPKLIESNSASIQDAVSSLINDGDADLEPELSENIIITGGSAAFPGLANRLERELKKINKHKEYKVRCVLNSHELLWNGALQLCKAEGEINN